MQRYFAVKREDNNFILKDTDMHHIKNVMRMKNNDNVEVVYDKKVFLCNINDNKIAIVKEILLDNELGIDITIAISLVNEQKFDLILQKLTELGVTRIIPLSMERTVVKIDEERYSKKIKRWTDICKEASEQSHRNIIPEITRIMKLKDLVKEDGNIQKLVCSTTEKENCVNKYLQDIKKYDRIMIVIGPEGGISSLEEEFLTNNGYQKASLGTTVLRVETAAIYVASVINYSTLR